MRAAITESVVILGQAYREHGGRDGIVGIGKTSIFKSATQDDYIFSEDPPTPSIVVCQAAVKKCKLKDGSEQQFKVWDNCWREKFDRRVTPAFLKVYTGFIIVYSVDNERSVERAKKWLTDIVDGLECIKEHARPIVLAANKIDLPDALTKVKDYNATNAKLAKIGQRIDLKIRSFGVSAKEGLNIEELFVEMAELIAKAKAKIPAETSMDSNTETELTEGCCQLS